MMPPKGAPKRDTADGAVPAPRPAAAPAQPPTLTPKFALFPSWFGGTGER
jgi:hypothetical protein